MTIKKIKNILKKNEDDYLKDGYKFVQGINLLAKYTPDMAVASEHNILYLCDFNENITEEDVLKLNRWGFSFGGNSDGWFIYT